jgi:hypothetical protein
MALMSTIRVAVKKVEPRNPIVASAREGGRPVCPAGSVVMAVSRGCPDRLPVNGTE